MMKLISLHELSLYNVLKSETRDPIEMDQRLSANFKPSSISIAIC